MNTIENVQSENSTVENSENSENQKVEKSAKGKKIRKQKDAGTDAINFDKVKIDISKGNKSLITKERSVNSKKSIYKGTEEMGEEDKKKFRGKLRRELRKFVNSILGKDRSTEERTQSILSFLKFYKKNWQLQDFKIENFSQSKNPTDQKDYSELLKYVQSTLK